MLDLSPRHAPDLSARVASWRLSRAARVAQPRGRAHPARPRATAQVLSVRAEGRPARPPPGRRGACGARRRRRRARKRSPLRPSTELHHPTDRRLGDVSPMAFRTVPSARVPCMLDGCQTQTTGEPFQSRSQVVGASLGRLWQRSFASSAESVGEFWFGQVAKCVIQSDFQCPGGAEPIRPFGDHSGLSVEAFDNATGELPPGSEPVQNQVAVRAQPCGQPPSSGRAASASSGCTSGRGTGRPSTATRSPTAIESPP